MEVESDSIEERIIKASFNVLESEGLAKTTTKKIAEKADVSEVTLFRKFKSKKRLIEVVKDYYTQYLLVKLDELFEYDEDIEIEEYLKSTYYKVINLSDNEINVVKVAMEEVRDVPIEYLVLSKISTKIIKKLKDFIKLQIKKDKIRSINPDVLALNLYSIIFESIVLWKVYGKQPQYEIDKYADDFLDIILNGIMK